MALLRGCYHFLRCSQLQQQFRMIDRLRTCPPWLPSWRPRVSLSGLPKNLWPPSDPGCESDRKGVFRFFYFIRIISHILTNTRAHTYTSYNENIEMAHRGRAACRYCNTIYRRRPDVPAPVPRPFRVRCARSLDLLMLILFTCEYSMILFTVRSLRYETPRVRIFRADSLIWFISYQSR